MYNHVHVYITCTYVFHTSICIHVCTYKRIHESTNLSIYLSYLIISHKNSYPILSCLILTYPIVSYPYLCRSISSYPIHIRPSGFVFLCAEKHGRVPSLTYSSFPIRIIVANRIPPNQYIPIYLPTYLLTYLPIYLSTYLPTYLPIYLPIYISIYLHIYRLFTYLPIYLPPYPSIHLDRMCVLCVYCIYVYTIV
jgi:hypothetical protein